MRVETVTEPGPAWDEFAQSRPEVSLGHAGAWAEIVRASYRLRAHPLLAHDLAGRIAGVLTLVEMRTWRGSKELVSLPFLDSAGVLASDPSAGKALIAAALELARVVGATALELRGEAGEGAGEPAAEPTPRVDLTLPLERDAELQWKALGPKVRNQTRKAEREGLVVAEAPAADLLDEFYAVYCENMRDLGSPAHAKAFFRALARALGSRVRFVVTRLGSRPVGGLVAVHFGARVSVPWASTLRSERARCPNNQIYWEAIRWAIARGARELDFGRSPRDSGTHRFKLGWGAGERELIWRRLSPVGAVLPGHPEGENRALRLVSRAWRSLPVPVATHLGARVRRFFPA